MHRAHRCTLADTVWAPTSANRTPALRRRPLPGRPPCRVTIPACPTRPTIPRAPRPRIRPTARAQPCAHCTSIAYALLPSSASPPHLSPRVAAAPGPWLARTAPYASLFRRMREKGPFPGNIRPKCMLFEIKMATSSPMHPFPGAIGRFRIHGARILPPRALFRVEEPEITHGAKMLPAPPGLSPAAACGPTERALRHATAACGTRHGRTGFAPCGAGLACLPHAPPCRLACARRGLRLPAISPAFIAAVLHVSCFAARIAPTVPSHPPRRPLRSG